MIKRQTTKELITASLFDLLKHNKSFNSISVQDIVDNCGISRRTFYNSFQDKYDVVVHFYAQTLSYDRSTSYSEFLLNLCIHMKQNRSLWKKILKDSVCCSYLEKTHFELQCTYLDDATAGNAYVKSLLRFYSHGVFKTLSEWITNDCQIAPETVSMILQHTVPQEIRHIYH